MYRLEIVTAKAGLEHFVWIFFPDLVPTAFSESFCIYACRQAAPLSESQIGYLNGWEEEEIIIAYACAEAQEGVYPFHVTPVEAAELTGYSEEYWRQQAWMRKIPGAVKAGKQWLLPRTYVLGKMKDKKE